MISDEHKEFNYGIALLKSLMCFEVVLSHCWANDNPSLFLLPFLRLKRLAVPVFMFLSFYLNQNKLSKNESEEIKKKIFKTCYTFN